MPFRNDAWQGWRRKGGGGAGVKWGERTLKTEREMLVEMQ